MLLTSRVSLVGTLLGRAVMQAKPLTRHLLHAAGFIGAVCCSVIPAVAYEALVSWSPVPDTAGYKIYVRQSGQPFAAGMDVGQPAADPDGAIRYVKTGLPIDVVTYFAITAYDVAMVESSYSNELSVRVYTSICGATPIPSGCRTPGRASLMIRDRSADRRDSLFFKWSRGAATTKADFRDPTASTSYGLCVYDQTGLLLAAEVPPHSEKWTALARGNGYKRRARPATGDGIAKVLLKRGEAGRAKILLVGKGENLPDKPEGALVLPVTAQVVHGDTGLCWEASFTSARENDGWVFKATR